MRVSTFLFRCDGSADLGMGHVVRCTSLAFALRRQGASVLFAMQKLSDAAPAFIHQHGFNVVYLNSKQSGSRLSNSDWSETRDIARYSGCSWIVVDHYGATAEYFYRLKLAEFKLAVIDDLAIHDLDQADWLLNQNLGAGDLHYATQPQCIKLLGPAFALLRPQFRHQRAALSRQFNSDDRNLLLTLGGGDIGLVCAQVLAALNQSSFPLNIRCVWGGAGPLPVELLDLAVESPHQVRWLENVTDMAELMAWADLSINAGGSTCWELCCLGVPMLVLSTSSDQVANAIALDQNGCARNMGNWPAPGNDTLLASTVGELFLAPNLRQAMSLRAQALVDGKGADKAARTLMLPAELLENGVGEQSGD